MSRSRFDQTLTGYAIIGASGGTVVAFARTPEHAARVQKALAADGWRTEQEPALVTLTLGLRARKALEAEEARTPAPSPPPSVAVQARPPREEVSERFADEWRHLPPADRAAFGSVQEFARYRREALP